MSTGKFNAGGSPAMDKHPIERKMEGGGGGVEILQVASCYWNRDKLPPDEPLGSYAGFAVLYFNSSAEFPYMPALLFALLLISELPYMRYYLHVTFTSLEFNQNSVT